MKAHLWGSEDFLFSSLTSAGKPKRGSQISYSNARSVLHSSLLLIGYEEDFVKKFGLHSFRVGATSFVFSSVKLTGEEIQFGGRWNLGETPKPYNVPAEEEMCEFSRVIAGGQF